MNNYIIDPSVFYWMNVLSIFQTALVVLGAFALMGFMGFAIAYIYQRYGLRRPEDPEEGDEHDKRRYAREMKVYVRDKNQVDVIRKWMIAAVVIGLVLVIASIFIPSKQASVEMLVARTATFDNVNWTVQQVKEIIDYIVSALKGAV